MSKEENNGWIKVEEGCKLPDYDENVLVYYEIDGTNKKEVVIHEYWEIGRITNCSVGKGYKHYQWEDKEYNGINPTHWQPLPQKPKK